MKISVKLYTDNAIEVDDNLSDDEIEEIVDKWILKHSYWIVEKED